jgi:hypothetical protein
MGAVTLPRTPCIRSHCCRLVVGDGGYFKGYGWKLKEVRKELIRQRGSYNLVLFTDSFDTYIFSSMDEIVEKFKRFQAPMVVSGEVNIWPTPHLAPHLYGARFSAWIYWIYTRGCHWFPCMLA